MNAVVLVDPIGLALVQRAQSAWSAASKNRRGEAVLPPPLSSPILNSPREDSQIKVFQEFQASMMEIPTYHRAPNFSIPPNGHIQLGTIISDLKELEAINHGDIEPIPAGCIYRNDSKGFQTTITRDRNTELGFWAKVLAPASFGAEVSGGNQNNIKTAVRVRDLETTYFFPAVEYMSAALQRPALRTFMEVSRKRLPVYMITGVKIARGATWESSSAKTNNAVLGLSLPDPLAGVIDLGPKVNSSAGNSSSTQVEDGGNFILAYRATKIWYNMRNQMKTERYLKGATMAGDSGPAQPDTLEDIDFIHDIAEDGHSADIIQGPKEGEQQDIEPSVWILHEISA